MNTVDAIRNSAKEFLFTETFEYLERQQRAIIDKLGDALRLFKVVRTLLDNLIKYPGNAARSSLGYELMKGSFKSQLNKCLESSESLYQILKDLSSFNDLMLQEISKYPCK